MLYRKKDWLRVAFYFIIIAGCVTFVAMLPVKKAKAENAFARVVGDEQPNTMLAPEKAVVEFTNLTIRPGRKNLEIKNNEIFNSSALKKRGCIFLFILLLLLPETLSSSPVQDASLSRMKLGFKSP